MTISLGSFSSLSISVAGNLFLAVIFLNALLNPLANADFIFKTGMLLFLIEFFSVHSGVVLSSSEPGRLSRLFLLGFYSAFVISLALIFSNPYLPGLFLLSLAAKLFGARATPGRKASFRAWIFFALFLFTAFVVITIAGAYLLDSIFPFPQEIISQKPANSHGLFVDTPQTLVFWGVLYYSLAALVEITLFASRRSRVR